MLISDNSRVRESYFLNRRFNISLTNDFIKITMFKQLGPEIRDVSFVMYGLTLLHSSQPNLYDCLTFSGCNKFDSLGTVQSGATGLF